MPSIVGILLVFGIAVDHDLTSVMVFRVRNFLPISPVLVDRVECAALAGEGVLGGFAPDEGLRLGVLVQQVVVDRVFEVVDAGVAAAAHALCSDFGKEALDEVHPGRVGGCEMQLEAGMLFQRDLHLRRLVGRAVVENQMDFAQFIQGPVDATQERLERPDVFRPFDCGSASGLFLSVPRSWSFSRSWPHIDVRARCFKVCSAGAFCGLQPKQRGHRDHRHGGHGRFGVGPAILGSGQVEVMPSSLSPIRRPCRRLRYSGGSRPASGPSLPGPSSCRCAWQDAVPMPSAHIIFWSDATEQWPPGLDMSAAADRPIATHWRWCQFRRITCGAGSDQGRHRPSPRWGTARGRR